jgi:OmcA/MtrC family decaheme c-type cytochrome
MTRPSQVDCGSCHTNIDWETGEGHAAGVQEDDFCSFCHEPDSGVEFDRSVRGAHTVQERSNQLEGVYVDIKSIESTGPGQSPTVTYAVFGKNRPIDPGTMNRLRFVLTGPNEDFDFYLQEDVRAGSVASGANWTYTFSGKLPTDAEGSYSLGFEGRNVVTLETPTGPIEDVRDLAENYLVPFAVTDGSTVARDMIVDDAKCESCHSNLAAHGGNRHNGGEYCQTCHAPQALGPTEITEGEEDSIHFKFMVHKIHRGADLENGYVMEGTDFSEVHFPGDLRDCEACHVDVDPNPNVFRSSAWLPLPEGRLPTLSPVSYLTEMQPMTAACLSCHDGLSAAQHADANTGDLGESCDTCHGEDKTYSAQRVHAR